MTEPSPFRYPKFKHKRIHSPPQRQSYKKYKPLLREEFNSRCVYCMLPDRLKGQESFGIDHYKPKRKFPTLAFEYSNLFYACNVCNSRKGDFWPSTEQLNQEQFIPNPCDHVTYDYFRATGPHIHPRNKTGEFALGYLDLNDSKYTEYRQTVLDLCVSLSTEILETKKLKPVLDSNIETCTDVEKKRSLLADEVELDKRLERLEGLLNDLVGY